MTRVLPYEFHASADSIRVPRLGPARALFAAPETAASVPDPFAIAS